ncbi:hypothetical protein BRADI_2g31815v3 [Brachypodium distachyon]|uniref:Uncharacterized protein n=1 Tax=Brachypodium distachyon TaxID=15368 RepID=A0A2K2DBE8_BRADI|nr:hypothetical protein BRADI_2g31815v3 [Brachypodium distachyon]
MDFGCCLWDFNKLLQILTRGRTCMIGLVFPPYRRWFELTNRSWDISYFVYVPDES